MFTAIDGLTFVKDFLKPTQQQGLIDWIDALPVDQWSEIRFRGVVAKRRMICFGWDYVTTSRSLRPAPPMPSILRTLRDDAGARVGLTGMDDFEQLILIRYPPGAGIGAHIDAPVFGSPVLIVSLGGDGRLRFSRRDHEKQTLALPSGSLVVLDGESRYQWLHQLMPVKARRHSITFRRLKG
ncbi:MAG: alpha-ketoglutarate-dependent dioxygenase AlkB [Myxococcota bacterium]